MYKLDLAFLAILDLPLSLLGLSSFVFQLPGHVIESGSLLTNTVTGFAVHGILREHTLPNPESSKIVMASRNSASAIARKLRVALCLKARNVKMGPGKRMHAVLITNVVGCGFSLSNVGVINSLKN